MILNRLPLSWTDVTSPMKNPKNAWTLLLIVSSMALLLVLQFFWLRSAYHKAADDLGKETNMLFRSTVFAMHDSLVQKHIESIPGDSAMRKFLSTHAEDSISEMPLPDTLLKRFRRREQTTKIQVLVTPGENDSVGPDIRPLVSRFFHNRGQGNYILRLGQDSLKLDSIAYNLKITLAQAGIHLPFQVVRLNRGEKLPWKDGTIVSEPVRVNPGHRYGVSFFDVRGLLLRAIIPQILFSVFLAVLMAVSFYVMYRSLLAQQRIAELKNDFISNVTHELKTPITTVGVALEALRNFKGLDNPQLTREYLDIAQNELNRLTLLTDKVLKTAIFENKGISFQAEKVDIQILVDQILVSMKLVFERDHAKVTVEKEGDDFSVFGDRDHLTNVVYNLLDNALKYSPGPNEIAVTLKNLSDSVVFSVADQGLGIAPEYQKRIFEKFFRVPTGNIHNIKGYGLGLSYAAQVIRHHRGSLTVESALGKGSTFVITLPKNEKN